MAEVTADHIADVNPDLLEEVSWDAILDSIQREQCIICLGPGIFADKNGVSLEAQLSNHLKPQAERLKIRLYDDGWLYYLPGHNVVLPWMEIKKFYNQPFPRGEAVLQKLVQLPFHLYISLTPDRKLDQAFQRYPHRFDFYYKNKEFNPQEAEKPSKYYPLLYNMLGELSNRESLVLTHDDYFIYVKSVFAGKSMSPKIRESIEDADNFIFLGVSFEQWYMHLFLRLLGQHENKEQQLKYAPENILPEKIQSFCVDQFNITFVPIGIENFVNALYERCLANEPKLIRQEPPASVEFPAAEIKTLLAASEVENAFETFFNAFNIHRDACKDVFDELIVTSGLFSELSKRYRLLQISFEEYNRERSKIISALIELVNQAEKCLNPR